MLDRSRELASAVRRFEALLLADPEAQRRRQQQEQEQQQQRGGAGPRRREDPRQTKQRQAFVNGSAFLANELDALAMQVTKFTRDSQKRSLYEDTGVALARSSDEIKRKMDATLKGIHSLKAIVEDSASRQLKQHFAIILDTLQHRFRSIGKKFQDCLEARTKALSTRQAEQARQFGAARVALSAPKPSVYNPAQARAQRMGTGPHTPPPGSPAPANSYSGGSPGAPAAPLAGTPLASSGMRRRAAVHANPAPSPPPPPAPSASMAPSNPYAPHMAHPGAEDSAYPQEQVQHFGQRQRAQYDRSAMVQRQRAMEMRNVETMLAEASQVFGRMASLVAEQGEMVDRIDEQIDVAGVEVEAGQNELLKYYNNLSKERSFIIKIFVTVILLASFFMYWWR